jgi:hypothetical protein
MLSCILLVEDHAIVRAVGTIAGRLLISDVVRRQWKMRQSPRWRREASIFDAARPDHAEKDGTSLLQYVRVDPRWIQILRFGDRPHRHRRKARNFGARSRTERRRVVAIQRDELFTRESVIACKAAPECA